ncbi:DUF6515 family protein [Bizionia arctica]|nr:DUF6515 family protein [Bizionia arctica]
MKAHIKVYLLPVLFLICLQVSAQTIRNTNVKTTTKSVAKSNTQTNKKVQTFSKKVPSSKVTYKTKQKKVASVRNVPNKTKISYQGQNYYYANNRYYTQSRGSYIVIAPKVGFKIKTLPSNYVRVNYNTYNYYNAQGVFYVQTNNVYEVVDPEIGTLVYELPDDSEKVVIDGERYYEYANILYERVKVNDKRAYEVVGIIDME